MKIDWRPLRRLSLAVCAGFSFLPFARPDYPWWTKALALIFGYTFIWFAEEYGRIDGDLS